MQRASDIVGKSIVSSNSGNKIGRVSDLLLDDSRGRLIGVVVSNGWLHNEQVLPFTDVQTLGGDAVIARTGSGLIGPRQWREQATPAARSSTLDGKPIVTSAGERVGSIRDLMVDEHSGHLDALEISARDGGRIARRRLLTMSSEIRMSGDVVVIPEAMAAQVESPEREPPKA